MSEESAPYFELCPFHGRHLLLPSLLASCLLCRLAKISQDRQDQTEGHTRVECIYQADSGRIEPCGTPSRLDERGALGVAQFAGLALIATCG